MKKNMQLTLLDKSIMFYESLFFIFFAAYQIISKIQTPRILFYLHIALFFSIFFTLFLIIRAILSKNIMWEKGKTVLFMFIILNIMITVFSIK